MGSRKTSATRATERGHGTLQWGRDDGVAEDAAIATAAQSSFNGAATMGSRKTTRRASGLPRISGFNGAATMGSRKTEPERRMSTMRCGFNGAATMGSRKTASPHGES